MWTAWVKTHLLTQGVLVVSVVALIIGYFFVSCRHDPAPVIPTETQFRMDSLKHTAASFARERDSLLLIVRRDTLAAITIIADAKRVNAVAEETRRNATIAGRRADSLARVASAHADSALLWRAAYTERTTQVDSLNRTVIQKDSAITAEHTAWSYERSARMALISAYAEDTSRRVAIERVNRDLETTIKRLERPCKIVGPIPCPSRTTTGVIGVILGALGGSAIR